LSHTCNHGVWVLSIYGVWVLSINGVWVLFINGVWVLSISAHPPVLKHFKAPGFRISQYGPRILCPSA